MSYPDSRLWKLPKELLIYLIHNIKDITRRELRVEFMNELIKTQTGTVTRKHAEEFLNDCYSCECSIYTTENESLQPCHDCSQIICEGCGIVCPCCDYEYCSECVTACTQCKVSICCNHGVAAKPHSELCIDCWHADPVNAPPRGFALLRS